MKQFEPEDISVVDSRREVPIWSTGNSTHPFFYVSELQANSASGKWYFDLLHTKSPSTQVSQLTLGYGHYAGSGSSPINKSFPDKTYSGILYKQQESIILKEYDEYLTFGTQKATDFYILSFNRIRFKEKLSTKSFELNLANKSGSVLLKTEPFEYSGSVAKSSKAGPYHSILQYNKTTGTYTTASNKENFGYIFPEVGTILLNPSAINTTVLSSSFAVTSSEDYQYNLNQLLKLVNKGRNFTLKAEERVFTTSMGIRVKSQEMNYSLNPTFTDTQGELSNPQSILDPIVYPTTIGLYNENTELVALAKFPYPVSKSFADEVYLNLNLTHDTPVEWSGPVECTAVVSSSFAPVNCEGSYYLKLVTAVPASPSPTPSNSISPSATPSISVTPSNTVSPTPSKTVSVTISVTPSNTVSPSVTPTTSVTPSVTPTVSVSGTPVGTPSPTPTPTSSPVGTPSPTPTISLTPTRTPSITPSITKSISVTPSISKSISVTPSITNSPSITPSITKTPSVTPSATPPGTPPASATPSPSITTTPNQVGDTRISLTGRYAATTGGTIIDFWNYTHSNAELKCIRLNAATLYQYVAVRYDSRVGLVPGAVLFYAVGGTQMTNTGKFVVSDSNTSSTTENYDVPMIVEVYQGVVTRTIPISTITSGCSGVNPA